MGASGISTLTVTAFDPVDAQALATRAHKDALAYAEKPACSWTR